MVHNGIVVRNFFLSLRFEGGGGSRIGILAFPALSDIGGTFSLKETLLWYDFLLAALDCYTWAFGEQLLTPKDIFHGRQIMFQPLVAMLISDDGEKPIDPRKTDETKEQNCQAKIKMTKLKLLLKYSQILFIFLLFIGSPDIKYTSNLFKSLQYFLSVLALSDIQAAYQCFQKASTEEQDVFSPKEIDEYNR